MIFDNYKMKLVQMNDPLQLSKKNIGHIVYENSNEKLEDRPRR